jgi:hypothetical protein
MLTQTMRANHAVFGPINLYEGPFCAHLSTYFAQLLLIIPLIIILLTPNHRLRRFARVRQLLSDHNKSSLVAKRYYLVCDQAKRQLLWQG